MRHSSRVFFSIWFIVTMASVLLVGTGCHSGQPNATTAGGSSSSTTRPKVTLGIQTSPAMALVMVAKDKGCFEEAGVDVEIKDFTAGKFALQAFLGGSLDFAIAGEVPTTLANLQGNKTQILTQVVQKTDNEVRVVALRDGALTTPGAYFKAKKRKLATSIGGGPEFYTYQFMKRYGISKDAITIVSQKPGDMPAALASHSVDAISIFDPMAYIAEKKLGPQGITFSDPNLYSELYVLVAKQKDLDDRRPVIDALLKGLIKAQGIIASDPEGAKQIVVKYTKLDKSVVDGIWKNFVFAPALTDQLVTDMNDETAWAREKGDVPASTATPDFLRDVILAEPLRALKPEAVKLKTSK